MTPAPTQNKRQDLEKTLGHAFKENNLETLWNALLLHNPQQIKEQLMQHDNPLTKKLVSDFVAAEQAISERYNTTSYYSKETQAGRRLRAWSR